MPLVGWDADVAGTAGIVESTEHSETVKFAGMAEGAATAEFATTIESAEIVETAATANKYR